MSQPVQSDNSINKAAKALRDQLRHVRRYIRTLLLIKNISSLTGLVIAALAMLILFDYLLRFPAWFRFGIWLVSLGLLYHAVTRWIRPALAFRPSLTELALRLEHTSPGKRADLPDTLAIGLELGSEPPDPASPMDPLKQHLANLAQHKLHNLRPSQFINPRRVIHSGLLGMTALTLLITASILEPTLTPIGLSRTLTPWTQTAWPKRTRVADAMRTRLHPIGSTLALRAALVHTDTAPDHTPMSARYRIITNGTPGPTLHTSLTNQNQRIDVPQGLGLTGTLFERLIDPVIPAPTSKIKNPTIELEYWFQTADDQTDPARIQLITPPRITSASATITPPDYTKDIDLTATPWITNQISLGVGTDERSIITPILQGSRIDLTLNFNKPMPPPEPDNPSWRSRVLDNQITNPTAIASPDSKSWTLSWSAAQTIRLPINASDQHDIALDHDAAFHLRVNPDTPPTAAITDPPQDQTMLASAVINVQGEARDDVGIRSIALFMQHARKPASSDGAPADPLAQPKVVATTNTPQITQESTAAWENADLSVLGLIPGDELWFHARAMDALGQQTDSTSRRILIISQSQMIQQMQAALTGVRKAAIRLEQNQRELTGALRSEQSPLNALKQQTEISQRISSLSQTIDQLDQRAQKNALNDSALQSLLDDAQTLLQTAVQRSDQAAQSISQSESTASITQPQDETRQNLEQVIEMLDRGQDSWVVRRSIEKLLSQQRSLMDQTASTTQDTIAKSADELSDQELTDLQRIAQRQRDLARQADEALDELTKRARQMNDLDPASAAGMDQAAATGRSQGLTDQLNQAADAIEQNQGSSATRAQQQALQSMQQMLDDLAASQQNKDKALRRQLQTIIQAIENLILDQEKELAILNQPVPTPEDTQTLAPGMMRLHTNTLAVHAKAASPQLQPIASDLSSASVAQSQAVTHLRSKPVQTTQADDQEQLSLVSLKSARDKARKLDDNAAAREAQKQRQELRDTYRQALEEQVALQSETSPLVGKTLTRRQRSSVRTLGAKQSTLLQTLTDLADKTEQLADASVVMFAHHRITNAMKSAAERLATSKADSLVIMDQDTAIRVLQSLVQALQDDPDSQDQDSFRSASEAGGQGSGSGSSSPPPLIPSLAELRLLRAMQLEAADLTRNAHDNGASSIMLDRIGQLQRDLAIQARKLIEKLKDQPKSGPPQPTSGYLTVAYIEQGFFYPLINHTINFSTTLEPPSDASEDSAGSDPAPPEPLPSLDELLGLEPDSSSTSNPQSDLPDAARQALDRKLSLEQASEQFAQAVDLMQQTADRLSQSHDASIVTQRLQQDILKKLDAMIEAAKQQSSSSSSSSSSQSQSQSESQSQPSQPQSQNASSAGQGDSRNPATPPSGQSTQLAPWQAPDQTTWGALPGRLRSSLMQGTSDHFSSLYKSLTEAYYKKLAEEAKP